MTFVRILLALLALTVAATAFAAGPANELLRLTPAESAFCVVVRDLRTHRAELDRGPWLAAFRASKLGAMLTDAPETRQLDATAQKVAEQLKLDLGQLRDDVFGDAVVLAYQNGPPGKPEEERGLLLTWTRDSDLAARFVERLNEVQKAAGEIKELRPLFHRGRPYFGRVKAKEPPEYYLLHGSVLAFSQQEAAIRSAIDLDLDAPSADAAVPVLAGRLRTLGVEQAAAVLLLNPRSFDAELAQKRAAAPPADAAFLKTFQACWAAVESAAVAVRIDQHLTAELVAAVKEDALPTGVGRLVRGTGQTSELWRKLPTDGILAAVGRLDPATFIDALAEFMTPEAGKALRGSLEQSLAPVVGKDVLPQLPGQLGPDWGVWLGPPAKNSALPQLLAAVRVRPGPAEQSLLDALDVTTTLVRVAYNANHPEPMRMKSVRHGAVEVKYLAAAGLPAGFQPAYAIKDGFLIVASSPEAVARFGAADCTPPAGLLVSLSFRRLDEYLKAHRDALAAFIAEQNQLPRSEALKPLEQLQLAIETLERLEVTSGPAEPGRVRVALRLHFTPPLKK